MAELVQDLPIHNLPAILIANALGVCLMCVMLFGNRWYFRKDNDDTRNLITLAVTIFISCIADATSFVVDGQPGRSMYITNWASNFWLYLMNVVTGMAWLRFFASHLHVRFSRGWMIFYMLVCLFTLAILVINFFVPVAFYIGQDNIYHRGSLFWAFMIINLSTVIGMVGAWSKARTHGVVVRFVPVLEVVIPVLLGIVVQSECYGISVIWPAVAIAYSGLLASLQNEMIYRDMLTGLFNRYYLDFLKKKVRRKQKAVFTIIMMDIDDFKSINDRFGHSMGDHALVTMTRVLTSVVGTNGAAIRYAGDEFVVVLNTEDRGEADEFVRSIRAGLAEWNSDDNHVYKLEVSVGVCTADLTRESVEDIMNHVDGLMYYQKRKRHGEQAENEEIIPRTANFASNHENP